MTSEEIHLEGDLSEWTAGLPVYQRELLDELISVDPGLDGVAATWLSGGAGSADLAPFGVAEGRSLYFEKFLDELHDLLCVADKYQEERSELKRQAGSGQAAIVASLTAVIVPVLGAAAPVVAPAIAVVMVLITRMGLSAWCETQTDRRAGASPGD